MLDQLSYKDKNTFLQNVHTVAVLTYLVALLCYLSSLLTPLSVGCFLIVILAVFVSDAVEECLPFLVMGIWVAVFVMILNRCLFKMGALSFLWS